MEVAWKFHGNNTEVGIIVEEAWKQHGSWKYHGNGMENLCGNSMELGNGMEIAWK